LLAQGQRAQAALQFERALAASATDNFGRCWAHLDPVLQLGNALSGLEEACDSAERVTEAVWRLRRERYGAAALPPIPCLEPAVLAHIWREHVSEEFSGPLSPAWTWQDGFGDCSFAVGGGALVVHAANGRDLWFLNVSAPRLLRHAPSGDFAVQTLCGPLSDEQPAIGGLLLWQDAEHYLVLEWGHWGPADIAFRGCLDNEDRLLGRGRLPGERVWLRLERQAQQVHALCSVDAREWCTAGTVEFPAREGEQAGLHAIGTIDRTIYPGAFPQGTAIRFTSFGMWTAEVG
jgi:hypothetical protein